MTYHYEDEDDDILEVREIHPAFSIESTGIELAINGDDCVYIPKSEALKLALAILETAGDTSGAIEDLKTHIEEAERVEKFKEIQKRQMDIIRPYGYTNYSSAPAVVRGLTDKILELENRVENV